MDSLHQLQQGGTDSPPEETDGSAEQMYIRRLPEAKAKPMIDPPLTTEIIDISGFTGVRFSPYQLRTRFHDLLTKLH